MIFQTTTTFGLSLTTILIIIIIAIILAIIIYTILLKIALSYVQSSYHEFGYIFITSVLCTLVGFIPCIGCVLQWLIINYRHKTGIGRAIVIWILAIIIGLIIIFLIIAAIVVVVYGVTFGLF